MKNEKIEDYLNKKMKGIPNHEKALKSIKALIKKAGLVNLDFSDVKSILDNAKEIRFFWGTKNKFPRIRYPEANGAFIPIEGNEKTTLNEARDIVNKISKKISEDARIIWGVEINEKVKEIKFFSILVSKNKR